jgi:hypothetical protein
MKNLILEGIVSTVDPEGVINIAPMGPSVDAGWKRLLLRPFKTSRTYENLAAVGTIEPAPILIPATQVRGHIIQEACRFYEFRVHRLRDDQDRAEIDVKVVVSGRLRDFFGFNRAKHAVVEAAILATRTHLIPLEDILAEFRKLSVLVEKTGGTQEHEAFKFLFDHVQRAKEDRDRLQANAGGEGVRSTGTAGTSAGNAPTHEPAG